MPVPFYRASGSPPPGHAPAQGVATGPSEPLALPPELIEALARLFAEAVVADIRQYPNLAELQAKQESTIQAPRSHERRRRASAPADGTRVQRKNHRLANAG